MLKAQDFRRIALGMTDALESAHMGTPDFRVNNRIFATLHGRQQGRHGEAASGCGEAVRRGGARSIRARERCVGPQRLHERAFGGSRCGHSWKKVMTLAWKNTAIWNATDHGGHKGHKGRNLLGEFDEPLDSQSRFDRSDGLRGNCRHLKLICGPQLWAAALRYLPRFARGFHSGCVSTRTTLVPACPCRREVNPR